MSHHGSQATRSTLGGLQHCYLLPRPTQAYPWASTATAILVTAPLTFPPRLPVPAWGSLLPRLDPHPPQNRQAQGREAGSGPALGRLWAGLCSPEGRGETGRR